MLSIEGMATAKDSSGENPTRILFIWFFTSARVYFVMCVTWEEKISISVRTNSFIARLQEIFFFFFLKGEKDKRAELTRWKHCSLQQLLDAFSEKEHFWWSPWTTPGPHSCSTTDRNYYLQLLLLLVSLRSGTGPEIFALLEKLSISLLLY